MADLFMKDPVSVSAIIPWNPIVYIPLLPSTHGQQQTNKLAG